MILQYIGLSGPIAFALDNCDWSSVVFAPSQEEICQSENHDTGKHDWAPIEGVCSEARASWQNYKCQREKPVDEGEYIDRQAPATQAPPMFWQWWSVQATINESSNGDFVGCE